MIAEIALPRGARLVTEAAPGARSFAVGFWFPLGSRNEAPNERGFAHFVEHMVFKGSDRRSARDISREIERVGGYLNAFTERDSLCFHCTVPASAWKLSLDILVDLVFCATFPALDFEHEREVIKSEIGAVEDDPDESSHDAFLRRIWPNDPLGLPIGGSVDDVDAAGREAVYDFYRRWLCPPILVASAAGPIPETEVAAELARLLDALPAPRFSPVRPDESRPVFMPVHEFAWARTSQVFLYEAVQVDGDFNQNDYYTLSVLNGAVGESSSSRLFQKLREEKGLCYNVYSTFALGRKACLWLASASSSIGLFPDLYRSLEAEMDSLEPAAADAADTGKSGMPGDVRKEKRAGAAGRMYLSGEEVAESVSRVAGSFDVALDDPEYRMKRIARQALYDDVVLDENETRARILAVDKKAVDEWTERLFDGSRRALFAWAPRSLKARLVMGRTLG